MHPPGLARTPIGVDIVDRYTLRVPTSWTVPIWAQSLHPPISGAALFVHVAQLQGGAA